MNYLASLFFCMLLSMSLAQTTGISVAGTGTVYGEPDMATLELGIDSVNEDLAVASDEASAVIRRVTEALTGAGVEARDIRTAYFNIWREQPFERNEGRAGQFHVNNVLNVRVRNAAQAGELINLSLEAGANTVNNIRYTLSDPAALERQARELAMQDARAKAEQLAELSGVVLGPVVMISDSPVASSSPVMPTMMRMEAADAGAAPVSGGELAVSVTVAVRFEILAMQTQ